MSCEWPSAATVSLSFQASGAAAPKTPSTPQSAPLARTWLMRASRLARKFGRLQVDPTVAAGLDAGELAAGGVLLAVPAGAPASPPPPHAASSAHSAVAAGPRRGREGSEGQV